MIKINLLGVAPPPTTSAPGPPTTRVFQVVTFAGALIVSFAIVGVIYKIWSNQVAELEHRQKREKLRQAELAGVKAQNERYQQRLKDLEIRINTIQALQNSRVGPVEMMSSLGDVVNRVNDVYLFTLAPAADQIELKGEAGTVDSMANFMSYLKKSGYFQNIQLQQFYEDDQHARPNYKFTLNCSFKSPTGAVIAPAPAAQGTAPQGAAPQAPAPRLVR
jgi:Tfp pilus assembly protein PilN